MENFSQTDEQSVILEHLSHIQTGSFLDIGAHDGVSLSNTRALALKGWFGTLVEPHPYLFLKLVELYGANEKITLVNSAMSNESKLTKFFLDGSDSKFSSGILENIKSIFPTNPYTSNCFVKTVSPKDLCEKAFDFVSIDTEGCDLAILKSLSGYLDSTTLICVEFNNADIIGTERLLAELDTQNFREVSRTRENIIAKNKKL